MKNATCRLVAETYLLRSKLNNVMRKDDRAKQNLFHAREWNKSAPSEAFESEIIFEEAKHCLGIRFE